MADKLFSISHSPYCRIFIPFLIGIILQEWFVFQLPIVIGVFVVLVISYVIIVYQIKKKALYAWRKVPGVLLLVVFLLFGYSYSALRKPLLLESDELVEMKVQLISNLDETEKSYKTEVQILSETPQRIYKHSVTGHVYFSKKRYFSEPRVGEIYKVKGTLINFEKSKNPYAFDYAEYLKNSRISFRLIEYESTRLNEEHFNISVLSSQFKESLLETFVKSGLRENELAVLNALFLGDKTLLNVEQKECFATAGAFHILAVSGLHVGIIFLLLHGFFKRILSLKKEWFRFLLIVIILWSYAFITGLSPSVMRATIMFSIVGISEIVSRKVNIYNLLSISFFVILLVDPLCVYHIGCWLSHLAVLTIVVFYPEINNWFTFRFVGFRWLWSLTALSLSAQIGTIPLGIYMFNYFPTYFLITNFLLVPVVAPVLILSISIMCFQFSTFFTLMLGGGLQDVLMFMNKVTMFISNLPFSSLENLHYEWYDLIILYLVVLNLIFLKEYRRLQYIKRILFLSIVFVLSLEVHYFNRPKSGFIVAHYPGYTVVNVFDRNTNEVWVDGDLSVQQLKYCLGGLWTKYHLPTKVEVKLLNSEFVSKKVGRMEVLIVDRPQRLTSFHTKDSEKWMICCNFPDNELLNVNGLLKECKVVISTKAPKGKYNKMKSHFKKVGCFCVNDSGALVVLNDS